MKLFERTPGYYLFWTGFVYFWLGMYNIFIDKFVPIEMIQAIWIGILVLPFVVPPFGRYFNVSVTWDQRMFNWFKGKKEETATPSNVVPFPKPELVPTPVPEEKEEPTKIFYRFGVTDSNRVAFSMGHNEITLNKEGCQMMIDQITFFMNQLKDEE